ncbi:MAG: type II toxin-antitoxin system Phd/YefM family antitoxin [Myxococcaceae bacterium]|nr:type II toxin-antitoxin system Phd/YefM family antitoxin [Myxococcaceae bacterium]MCI0673721.1 type II toxin-antitoxin system Phd/YefM family antitoxin [Myxococcaceae bacterium]
MRVVPLRDAKQGLSGLVDEAQENAVLITRHGRPAAVVLGVDGYDMEEVFLMQSPDFWKWVEERRGSTGPRLGLDEVRAGLGLPRTGGSGERRREVRKRRATAARKRKVRATRVSPRSKPRRP